MVYSCNDNQNYFVEQGRTTSRVLQQPGGKSSIQLGWGEPQAEGGANKSTGRSASKKKQQEVTGKIGQVKTSDAPPVVSKDEDDDKKEENKTEEESASKDGKKKEQLNVSNNKFASGSNMNCNNVITDRPSSRVLAPPGGKTSWTLG